MGLFRSIARAIESGKQDAQRDAAATQQAYNDRIDNAMAANKRYNDACAEYTRAAMSGASRKTLDELNDYADRLNPVK